MTALEVALTQVGVKEYPPNSNNVEYNTWYYGKEVSGSAYPWCAVFVAWCFDEANEWALISDVENKASCNSWMRWAKKAGKFGQHPIVGSVVLFDWDADGVADHMGFVYKLLDDGRIQTVEGNTSYGNDSNGGEVMIRTRAFKNCLGFIDVEQSAHEDPKVSVELPMLSLGDAGNAVMTLQCLLIHKFGRSCGYYGMDGEFGNATDIAVRLFQTSKGLEIDGVVGKETWTALLN